MSFVFLREAPFVRLVFPVIMGIIVHECWPYWNVLSWILLVLLGITGYILVYRISTAQKFQFQVLTGLVITLALTGISFGISHFQNDYNHEQYVSGDSISNLHIRLQDDPMLKGKYYKSKARVLNQDGHPSQASIMVYLEISEVTPLYGDEVVMRSHLNQIEPPSNPMEFDYKRYMQNQLIEYQSFVRFRQWTVVKRNTGNVLFKMSYRLKRNIETEMEKHFSTETHIAMLKALLLGDKSGIDGDLKSSFTQTGTMHVMAVSGLHVGIFFAFMNGFLGLIFRNKWKVIGTIFALLTLWFFALITGFSPSVSRACFMFSILAIGTQLNRNTSIYNSVACAAFCLLVIDPKSLFNVGFQFSFLAVIGIVSLQKPLRSLVKTKSWFLSKVLDLTAVSVAAQLATLPLGLFYFGQFPVLFFLSNLFVIPAITIILYAGLCFILLSKIGFLAGIFAWLLKVYLWFVISTVECFQSVPFAFLDKLYFSKFDLAILVVLVISVGLLLVSKNKNYGLPLAMLMSITLLTNQSIRRFQQHKSVEMIQFDLGKQTCSVLRTGHEITLLTNAKINEQDWTFHCKPYLVSRGVQTINHVSALGNRDVSAVIVNGDTLKNDLGSEHHSNFKKVERSLNRTLRRNSKILQ